ncbi:Ras-specific guanine nucleotide-releasing factor RalGPS1 [Lamellibrachia satsuma]|nr:Ras-specific guanine nucleotide-releasing factor RalGPS1 [Lamellibrachia satsuma]
MACRVLHEGKTTDQLDIQTGVRQGSILSPFLFLVAIDRIMRTSTGQKNGLQWTLWEQLVDLDLALLSHNQKQMQEKTSLIETTAATSGLNVNKDKTKIMKINSSQLHYKEKSLKCDTSEVNSKSNAKSQSNYGRKYPGYSKFVQMSRDKGDAQTRASFPKNATAVDRKNVWRTFQTVRQEDVAVNKEPVTPRQPASESYEPPPTSLYQRRRLTPAIVRGTMESVEVDYELHSTPSSSVSLEGHGSQDSLDGQCTSLPRIKTYDAVVFDVQRVSPEDFASQITLMDLPVFKEIQPDELTSCAWTTKEKLTKAPNVVAFTRRFNHVNFWVQKEILTAKTLRTRADVLSHFIKICKRLLDLNNLHAVMAVISALQSAPIFRLSKTWAVLSKRDRSSYEKIADLFSEANNRQKLRDYMSSIKLPSVPYLGLYLTDLVYIDVAHPHSGGMESAPRRTQMNNILRVLAEYQQSTYDNLTVLEHVQNYLKSVRYIEELQKFVEDDNYKLSLKIEPLPSSPDGKSTVSRSKEGLELTRDASSCCDSPKCHCPSSTEASLSHHRKASSLGASFRSGHQHRHRRQPEKASSLPSRMTAPYMKGQRHLIDDSVLEEHCTSSGEDDGLPTRADAEYYSEDEQVGCIWPLRSRSSTEKLPADFYRAQYTCEGCVRRKTILKYGKKPSVASWTRYWMALWGTSILLFPARSIRGTDREAFKSDPSKMTPIVGWMVVLCQDAAHPDTFQLTDPVKGHAYKFRSGSMAAALEWCNHLDTASKAEIGKPQDNLIDL